MTKIELVTAITEATGVKKTQLMEKRKDELEIIYAGLEPQADTLDLAELAEELKVEYRLDDPENSNTSLSEIAEETARAMGLDNHQSEALYGSLCEAVYHTGASTPSTDEEIPAPVATQSETETPAEETDNAEVDAPAERPKKEKKPREKKEKKPKEPKLSDREKIILASIPEHPEFKGVDSVMDGKMLLKKAEELHGLPVKSSCAMFVSLKNKGYYTAKGKKSGQSKTTFQLTEFGIQYLKDNGLLTA